MRLAGVLPNASGCELPLFLVIPQQMATDLIDQLRMGDLCALFYKTLAEQFRFIIPYLAAGLAANQRCLYIADDTPVALILKKLEAAGVDVEAAKKRGAI